MNVVENASYARHGARADVEALKQAHPIEELIEHYGIQLRRQGRAAVGRCPFHSDGGRPNLHVFADTRSWWCFRCHVGGDVVRFVGLAEDVSFREAVERLGGAGLGKLATRLVGPAPPPVRPALEDRDPDELEALQAATALYHHRPLTDTQALTYVAGRGFERAAVERFRIGYAAGDELLPYLHWRRLALGPALRAGLLNHSGKEFLAGRLVVPEVRDGQPVWMVGRILEQSSEGDANSEHGSPKYLALRGSKPLLGIEQARGSQP